MTSGRVAGKTAVVTGGASGIGAASVRLLEAEGAHVVVADLATGIDITSPSDLAGLAASLDRVDIVVNSAAITDPAHQARDGNVVELDAEVWDRTMAVDLTGTLLVCRALVPRMTAGGSIISITSNAGLAGDTSLTAYAAAKGALAQLTRSMATQLGHRGIRCNSISPAHIASPSFAANVPAEVQAMLENNCLLPRLGRVEDVAAAVLFLASDESSFVTGVTIRVDGGALAHLPTYAQLRALDVRDSPAPR